MKRQFSLALLSAIVGLGGCANFQVSSQVQSGRMALVTGNPAAAVGHFQRATEMNPQYVYQFSPLEQGVWTYLGRAYYGVEKYSEAQSALERARSLYDQDYLAMLYLGLTLARSGNRQGALNQIESGLQGLHEWLEYIPYYTTYGEFWDPNLEIRSEIDSDLAMISSRDIEWQKLIASEEWIGKKLEEEIDLARRDESRERLLEGGDNDSRQ